MDRISSTFSSHWALLPMLLAVIIAPGGDRQPSDWRTRLQNELPLLGHRNWIVIADAAYPAQSKNGIETIATGADQLEVVKAVLTALDQTKHVRPTVYLDAELLHVTEDAAPGIKAYREKLTEALGKRAVTSLPHDEILSKLDKAGETHRILVLKTNLTIPYTSAFLQLESGYWSDDAEKKLREAMKGGK